MSGSSVLTSWQVCVRALFFKTLHTIANLSKGVKIFIGLAPGPG